MSDNQKLQKLREAGRGGMGEVFEVWDPVIARRLALKQLRGDRSALQLAFVEEARIAGRLEHPHIVPVHGMGMDGDSPFFTMTWVDGETLEDRLRKNYGSHSALAEHLEILAKVVDAVAYAHERGVIHRDLKPENILVGKHGRVYVTDWGIARIWNRDLFSDEHDDIPRGVDAADGVMLGTTEYMSPEQAKGENSTLGPACDIWALGVILYQCLAGRTPFRRATADLTISAILGGEYPAAESIVGDHAPTELEQIVARALRYRPGDRYASLAEFESDLRRYMRGTSEMPTRTYAKGDVIVLEGETGREAYILRSGSCEVWADVGQDEPRRVAKISAGEFFGEAALVQDTERSASVVAAAECTVSVVGREALELERGRMQPWMASFVSTLVDRFRSTNKELHEERARNGNGLLLQASLWIRAFGESDGTTLRGSWRGCAAHLMAYSGLDVGPLRIALERYEGVSIDGRDDVVEILEGEGVLRELSSQGKVES